MIDFFMAAQKTKIGKNRYAHAAKYSEYKTLQLLECFARDLSIRDAAKVTRMTERTVRDRYAEIRGKLLKTCLDIPDLFGGFGHLLLDPMGAINLHMLEALFFYSESAAFKERMAKHYPKFRSDKDSVLIHVIEVAIRHFMSVEIPIINADFHSTTRKIMAVSQVEACFLQSSEYMPSIHRAKQLYWQGATRRWCLQNDWRVRRYSKNTGEGFFRDLKIMLRYSRL